MFFVCTCGFRLFGSGWFMWGCWKYWKRCLRDWPYFWEIDICLGNFSSSSRSRGMFRLEVIRIKILAILIIMIIMLLRLLIVLFSLVFHLVSGTFQFINILEILLLQFLNLSFFIMLSNSIFVLNSIVP